MLSDKADLSDSKLTEALKRYFDKHEVMSKRVQYCGLALVGFDASFYPGDNAKAFADKIALAARTELEKWKPRIGNCLKAEKLQQFDIDFFCLPLPSAEAFRKAFLTAMGLKK